MSNRTRPIVVIPGDDPQQIANSSPLERLREIAELKVYRTRPASLAEQVERAKDAEVLINSRGHLRWPAEALAQLPRLRFITTVSIGTDAIDLSAAQKQGIVVANIPGRTAPVVAEGVRLYLKRSDGTNWDNDDGEGDIALSAEDKLRNCLYVGTITVDEAAADIAMSQEWIVETLAREIAPIVFNDTVDNLQATNNLSFVDIMPYDDEIQ